jgi:hypothetical protein
MRVLEGVLAGRRPQVARNERDRKDRIEASAFRRF